MSKPKSEMPHSCEEVSIEVTNECHLACAHCSSEGGVAFEKELDTDLIKKIINTASKKLGTRVISLSGGEPLLRPDLWDIIYHIKDQGMNVLLYTCGNYRSEDTEGELVSAKSEFAPDRVKRNIGALIDGKDLHNHLKVIFSVEGLEVAHDALTRRVGSFKNVLDSIEMFRGICTCETHFTPNRLNYRQIPDVFRMCEDIGISKMSLLRLVPQGRCVGHNYELLPTKEEMIEILRIIHRSKLACERRESKTALRIGDPLNWEFFWDNRVTRRCRAGIDRILIRSNGEVQFCAALKHSPNYDFGNVFKDDLVWMWNESPIVKQLRRLHYNEEKVEGGCVDCEFYLNCHGGCTSQRIATHGDMFIGPDPLCTKENWV